MYSSMEIVINGVTLAGAFFFASLFQSCHPHHPSFSRGVFAVATNPASSPTRLGLVASGWKSIGTLGAPREGQEMAPKLTPF